MVSEKGRAMDISLKGKLGDTSLLLQVIIFSALIVLTFFLQGGTRWTLALIILFFAGIIVARRLSRDLKKPSIWRRESELDEFVHRELPQTDELVDRAFKGKRLSQAMLEQKLKKIFIDKLMDKRNLKREEIDELMKDEKKLDKVVGDETLSDFLVNVTDPSDTISEDEEADLEKDILERGGESIDTDYKGYIKKIMKRMKRWS